MPTIASDPWGGSWSPGGLDTWDDTWLVLGQSRTLRCYVGQALILNAKRHGQDGDVSDDFFPSETPPVWTVSSHALAEFFELSPDQHTIKVRALAIGTVTVIATLSDGAQHFIIDIVATPSQTLAPDGVYATESPLLHPA